MKTKIVWLNDLIENKQRSRQKKLDVPDHMPAPTVAEKPTESSPESEHENRHFYRKGGYHPVKIRDVFRNRYAVIRKLGWGHFSTVWLCWDQQDSRFIALKIVRSAIDITISALHEVELLLRAKNCESDASPQKIVRLLDAFTTTGANGTHICMAFDVLGHDLLEAISRTGNKGLPLTNVKSILRQVLAALDYLHTTCNIIHTDIKPSNICLDENEVLQYASGLWDEAGLEFPASRLPPDVHEVPVTLADLGNACWVDQHFNPIIQTWPYRSPEVILGFDYQSNADVWSTACTAFELATGRYLFPPCIGHKYYSDEQHYLARITGLLGDVPKRMTSSSRFFTRKGKLRFVPSNFDSCGLVERLTEWFQWDMSEAKLFAEFLLPMLAMDPDERPSARDCLGHKWLEF